MFFYSAVVLYGSAVLNKRWIYKFCQTRSLFSDRTCWEFLCM